MAKIEHSGCENEGESLIVVDPVDDPQLLWQQIQDLSRWLTHLPTQPEC